MLQPVPIICLVIHARRLNIQVYAPDRLMIGILVTSRYGHLGHSEIGTQSSLDLLLGWHDDGYIAFDHCLARQRIAFCHIPLGETQGAAAAYIATGDLDHAATTTALAATGLNYFNSSLARRLSQQRASLSRYWIR